MWTEFKAMVSAVVGIINPYAVMVIIGGAFLFYQLYLAQKKYDINWVDMVARDGKMSLSKLLQLTGGLVATWVIIYLTLHDKMSTDFLFTYLAYVGAVEGWSKFVSVKWGAAAQGGTATRISEKIDGELHTEETAEEPKKKPDSPPPIPPDLSI